MSPATAKTLRVVRMKELGCLPCRKEGRFAYCPELHHPTEGGRRISDDLMYPCCKWHHQGTLPADCKSSSEAFTKYGPSLAKNKRAYIVAYGTERELLAETERLLALRA